MKKFFLIYLFLGISYNLLAQENTELSTYEKFLISSKVSVFEKEYKDFFATAGNALNNINFRVFKAVSLNSKDKFEGLYVDAESFGSSIRRSSFTILDQVEISELIKFLDLIIPKFDQKFSFRKEYVYNTQKFKAALHNTKTNPYTSKVFVKADTDYNYWIFSIEVGNISSVTIEFADLKKVEEFNDKLKSLKFE